LHEKLGFKFTAHNTHCQQWERSVYKWQQQSHIYTKKNPDCAGLRTRPSSPPRCPYWADHNQNFLNLVAPCLVHVCHIWSGLVGVCRSYSRNIAFSDPSHYSLQYTRLKRVYRLTAYNYNSAGEWR